MNTSDELRRGLADFLGRDFVGPAHGMDEILEEPPALRYLAGVLFPKEDVPAREADAVAGVEGDLGPSGGDEVLDIDTTTVAFKPGEVGAVDIQDPHDDYVTLANRYRPSALALSYLVEPQSIELTVSVQAAVYESKSALEGDRKKSLWQRRPLPIEPVLVRLNGAGIQDFSVCAGLRLRVVSRERGSNRLLVTTSLYNNTVAHHSDHETYFQVQLSVCGQGEALPFIEYRNLDSLKDDPEEMALEMLYRERRVFAIGHGCAADWEGARGSRSGWVSSSVLPVVEVPPIVPRAGSERFLSMQFLMGDSDRANLEIPAALREFCLEYESWIVGLEARLAELDQRLEQTGRTHISRCREALQRMLAGIEVLESDERSMQSFRMMNRAMLMQQCHARLRRSLTDPWLPLPGSEDYTSDWDTRRGYWRSFQLAFLLIVLPGLLPSNESSGDDGRSSGRHLVDLIWFPTGGGKTEAYLGASAFLIFRARLSDKDRSGCQILMRYTLRLLTSQQFQRAASLICACELIRRKSPDRLGATPISIGLWVGMSLTPNDEQSALSKLQKLARRAQDTKNPFQLLSCPWCGTEMDNADRLGYQERNGRQIFLCPSRGPEDDRCPFSKRGDHLPICVVDESIYASPPTLIVGTVDKFAMLAWREQAGSIFRGGGGPDLIIQDELHLISGPLGSIMGLYEGIIEFLCSRSGKRPKIIASTATIRHATRQAKALYDRELFQFPPSGLDSSDSFFAIESRGEPGRMYLGLMPTAASSPLTAQVRAVVAMQQGVAIVGSIDSRDEIIDPYWTLIQYYSSLKELGRAATFVTSDIPEFLPTMHRRYGLEGAHRRYMRTAEELTSRKNEDEIPQILKRLETPYRTGAQWDDQALDTVLATNMISVGVDVDRLGLMLIVTQPKSTAEYIQASSRVGRARTGPGLVLTLLNPNRPRDRSHYEQFRSFHEAFYKYVEPTSVTPFSVPSLERALHAVLVIAGRHVAGWRQPREIDIANEAFVSALEFLSDRVRRIDPEHQPEFEELLARRLEEWSTNSERSWGTLRGGEEDRVLMRVAGAEPRDGDEESWETLTSMRNVDVECSAEVVPGYASSRGAGV